MDDDPIMTEEMWAEACRGNRRQAELEELTPQIVGRPMSMVQAILAGDLVERTGMAPEDAYRTLDPPRRRWPRLRASRRSRG